MKKKQYKKLMTRSFPLVFFECWYWGEKFGLPKICQNKMYFEPLFIHNQNLGTDVYYDIADKKQNPVLLVEYFDKHSSEFKILADSYIKNYIILKNISEDGKLSNLEKINNIFEISKEMFPILTTMVVIGNSGDKNKHKKIIKLSNGTRKKTEDFVALAINALLKEMAKILPRKYQEYLYFLKLDEIISRKITIATLKSRKNKYIFYQGKIYNNPDIDKFLKTKNIDIVKEEIVQKNDDLIIKGNSAYRGKIKGVVRKVFEVLDMKKVKKGDILVTSMTTPDLIAINKNFSAIITDEGGITCHAAIIAREMKKPCIIGTKIAMQVLKDGDLVEVDANKGVVRILK